MLVWVLTQQKMFHTVLIVPVVRQQGQDFKVCLFPGQANIWVKPLCWQPSQMPSLVLKHGVESKAGHRISRCSHPAAGSSSNVPHSTCHGAGSGGLQAGAWSPLVLVPQYCNVLHRKTETPLWSLTKTKQWADARKPCLNLCTPSVFW